MIYPTLACRLGLTSKGHYLIFADGTAKPLRQGGRVAAIRPQSLMAVGWGMCFFAQGPYPPEDAGPCSPPEPSTWVRNNEVKGRSVKSGAQCHPAIVRRPASWCPFVTSDRFQGFLKCSPATVDNPVLLGSTKGGARAEQGDSPRPAS
jgi:hypothetical protein